MKAETFNPLLLTSEKVWRQQVLQLAKLNGWECYFTWTSIHSPAGFPDLVLCRPPRIVFAELKTERGKVTEAQTKWILTLGLCPVEVYVWRPRDFDVVAAILRR